MKNTDKQYVGEKSQKIDKDPPQGLSGPDQGEHKQPFILKTIIIIV